MTRTKKTSQVTSETTKEIGDKIVSHFHLLVVMFVICNVRKDLAVRMKQLIKPQMRKNLKSEIGLIRICLMIMKCYILNVFCILFFRVEVQRNFLKKIER